MDAFAENQMGRTPVRNNSCNNLSELYMDDTSQERRKRTSKETVVPEMSSEHEVAAAT